MDKLKMHGEHAYITPGTHGSPGRQLGQMEHLDSKETLDQLVYDGLPGRKNQRGRRGWRGAEGNREKEDYRFEGKEGFSGATRCKGREGFSGATRFLGDTGGREGLPGFRGHQVQRERGVFRGHQGPPGRKGERFSGAKGERGFQGPPGS